MKKWKVGIVGLRRGRGFVSVFGAHPEVEVTALCDLDQNRLADLADAFQLDDQHCFTEFDQFVNADMDIVVIATPIALHAEQTIKSLEAGKHVLCEQTAAYTIDDCAKVVDAVKRTGRHYMMAENYCYFHYIREWKKLVDAGKFGRFFYAEAEYVHEIKDLLHDPETGKECWRHNRPPIYYCAHCLGPLLTLMDDRIVQACGAAGDFTIAPDRKDHIGYLDFEVGLFRTQKGAVIKILRSQTAPRYPHLVYYSLYGTKGYVENGRRGTSADGRLWLEDEHTKQDGDVTMPCPTVDPNAPEEAKTGGHGTSEYYLIRDFLAALEANRRPPIDVIRAMDFTIPGLVAHESAMTDGNWRETPLFDW